VPDDLSLFGLTEGDEGWFGALQAAADSEPIGRLGRNELLEEVGRGGQGVVYRARQLESGRIVALKRLRAGSYASPQARSRFEREVEVAARLSHPGIVAMYDVDVVEGGPVLTMEWVDGRDLAEWARSRTPERGAPKSVRLAALRERLVVFTRVCEAVEHAHRTGIIHRDLKPSNVLVDAADRPRVLDFGIAKWLDDAQDAAGPALTEDFIGTPAYASPEQLEGGASELDTRSDVYSLGVLLYEVLTGELPNGALRGRVELLDAARRGRPRRASEVAAEIDRELDTVVARALECDPEQRYPTVAALADDLERYLRGEPVLAHPQTVGYQLRKLVQRHRLAFGLAAVLALCVVGFAAFALHQASALAEERDAALGARREAALARDEARREAARANGILDFLLGRMVAVAEPSAGAERTVAEFLEQAAADVVDALADDPATEAEVRRAIGDTQLAHGAYAESVEQLELAHALTLETAPPGSLGRTRAARSLGRALERTGDYAGAVRRLEEAVAGARALGDPELLVGALSLLGQACARLERFDEAEALFRECRERAEAAGLLGWVRVARANLVAMFQIRGASEEARAELVELVGAERTGEGSLELSFLLTNLADVEIAAGDYAVAAELLREALAVQEEILGEAHPRTCLTRSLLGQILGASGETEEAEELVRRSLAIAEAADLAPSQELGLQHLFLANVLSALGDHAGRADSNRRGLEVLEEVLGPLHEDALSARNNLGAALLDLGDLESAGEVLHELAELLPDAPDSAIFESAANLLCLHAERLVVHGRSAEAERSFLASAGLLGGRKPGAPGVLAHALRGLARLERARGDDAAAAVLEEDARRTEAGLRGE